MMDGLLTLARERKINGHGDSTTKTKNGQKKKKIIDGETRGLRYMSPQDKTKTTTKNKTVNSNLVN